MGSAPCHPSHLPFTTWQGGYGPNLDVALEVLRHCDLRDQMHLAATSAISQTVVNEYNHRHLNRLASLFFSTADELFRILWACKAVISGTTVLNFLLPESRLTHQCTTLDIYICCQDWFSRSETDVNGDASLMGKHVACGKYHPRVIEVVATRVALKVRGG